MRWPIALLLALALAAHGATDPPTPVEAGPVPPWLLQLFASGSLPSVMAFAVWWFKNLTITVELGEKSLLAIRRSIRRAGEHPEPDSDDPKGSTT